jgi:hypothetical protein
MDKVPSIGGIDAARCSTRALEGNIYVDSQFDDST